MGTEIQDGMNEYKQWTSKQKTVEKKNLAWYTTGINKLIDQYRKCLTRYGDYVEKYVITWKIKFGLVWSLFVHFFVENASAMQNFWSTSHIYSVVAYSLSCSDEIELVVVLISYPWMALYTYWFQGDEMNSYAHET